jgi:UDPglucose 6-dehydrogenase
MKKKIGIIGYGFVGKAVAASYENRDDVKLRIHDPAYPEISKSLNKLKEKCDVLFICVPTNQSKDGSCNTSILEQVLTDLEGFDGLVISKSTAPPLAYKEFETKYNLKLVHAPEFLTQVNAVQEYLSPTKVIIGCAPELWAETIDVILPYVNLVGEPDCCSIEEASMFKYLANTMLAMKVIINNEFSDLCQAQGINWDRIAYLGASDRRLGNTHWAVPGPDGKRGFGGACFPKDTAALQYAAKQLKVKTSMLDAAIKKNQSLRDDIP